MLEKFGENEYNIVNLFESEQYCYVLGSINQIIKKKIEC